MIPTDRYCHSGPGNGGNSILTTLSVILCPFVVGRQNTLKGIWTCSSCSGAVLYETHVACPQESECVLKGIFSDSNNIFLWH